MQQKLLIFFFGHALCIHVSLYIHRENNHLCVSASDYNRGLDIIKN